MLCFFGGGEKEFDGIDLSGAEKQRWRICKVMEFTGKWIWSGVNKVRNCKVNEKNRCIPVLFVL